jgi:hypothetical protein
MMLARYMPLAIQGQSFRTQKRLPQHNEIVVRRCVMVVVMNMSSYEIERGTVEAEYGNEAVSSGWNPPLTQLRLQPFISTKDTQRTLPADLATINVELFLQRM